MPDEPDADAYTVALEEGRRAIDQQREDLKSLRDRATSLLTVSDASALAELLRSAAVAASAAADFPTDN